MMQFSAAHRAPRLFFVRRVYSWQGSEVIMLRKALFAAFGLALVVAMVTPEKAHAGVVIGVTVGGPVVVRPAYPYPYAYARPVPVPPPVLYARPYPGPVFYGRCYARHYWRHEAFERHEYLEHRGYGRR
jgi:hypothetical protein